VRRKMLAEPAGGRIVCRLFRLMIPVRRAWTPSRAWDSRRMRDIRAPTMDFQMMQPRSGEVEEEDQQQSEGVCGPRAGTPGERPAMGRRSLEDRQGFHGMFFGIYPVYANANANAL